MTKIHTENGYDFYIGIYDKDNGDRCTIYNIVTEGASAPSAGYFNMLYIEKVKGIKFPSRYQPTNYGMSNLYTNGGQE
jgi:hypothetical protein